MKKRLRVPLLALGSLMGFVCFSVSAVSQDRVREGLALMKEGKTEAALTVLRQAVEADPSDPAGHTALGTAALQAQRFDQAQRSLERAVALDPKSQTALYSLALLYEKQNLFSQARGAWEKFLALSPSTESAELARRHLERLP
jgi:cytochrome c-type biogenesis protein CcmH/NrfG